MASLFTGDNETAEDSVLEEGEGFDTWDLLDAVDHFDEMRTHLNDAGPFRPPIMRDELLALHQLAMEAYPGGPKESLVKLYDAAEDLESIAFDLMMQAEKLHEILQSLTATEPEDLRGY
jgi:hypothetical protein